MKIFFYLIRTEEEISVSHILRIPNSEFRIKKIRHRRSGDVFFYLSAAFACSVKLVNAAGSAIAISESIFLLRVMSAFLRPFINVE